MKEKKTNSNENQTKKDNVQMQAFVHSVSIAQCTIHLRGTYMYSSSF